jgi:hypothetical protein
MWNSLPDYIVGAPSMIAFKNRLDKAMENVCSGLKCLVPYQTRRKSSSSFKLSLVMKRSGQMTRF